MHDGARKVGLITGASPGLGKALAEAVIAARRPDGAEVVAIRL
jgi:NAD(P)-dependent dehydrogenase (short-subunit alcohol dehydrogenase family)